MRAVLSGSPLGMTVVIPMTSGYTSDLVPISLRSRGAASRESNRRHGGK